MPRKCWHSCTVRFEAEGMTMKRTFPLAAVIGALIVVLIVTGATLWMSSGARSATDQAVSMVSDFYLEELAGRRSQVVSRFFETKAEQIERAVSLINPRILSSQDTLRQYIGNVKMLHGLDLFALVDEDNVVYTDHSTYMGGSRYTFLSDDRSGKRAITTASTYGAGKQICLAVPVQDRSFMGKKLTTCFIEINMDDMEILNTYSNLVEIEEQFHIMKSTLDTRPIFVRTKEHIIAHLAVCTIALILIRLIQRQVNLSHPDLLDPNLLFSNVLSADRIQSALNKWKVEKLGDVYYRFCDSDNADLALILNSFGISIPTKCFRTQEIKQLKTAMQMST